MKQFNDYESSTRVCACGASRTWSGLDDGLAAWTAEHAAHDPAPLKVKTTADGMRAYVPAEDLQAQREKGQT